MAEAEKQVAALYSKTGASILTCMPGSLSTGSSGEGSPPSPKPASVAPSQWLNPLYLHVQKSAGDSEAFCRFVKETVTLQLDKIKDDLRKRGKDIRQRLSDAQARLGRQHEELNAAINAHERGWKLRLGGGEEASLDEAMGTTDLYITEQALRQTIALFLRGKEAFSSILMDCFRQTRLLEQELANATKEILGEALRVRSQQFAAASEVIAESLTRLQSFDSLMEWRGGLREHKLDWDWEVETPPLDGFVASVFSQIGCSLSNVHDQLTATVKSVRVVKSGFLMRPSTFTRSYSVVFCVLSDSAFLHCFIPGEGKQQSSSAGATSPRPLRIPPPSMQLHFKALAELNNQASQVWINETEGGGLISALSQPILSIPLLHPDTKVFPNSEGNHSFTIVVPGGSTFFSRSERKHVLRSFLEEDMVEWCIAIKGTIPVASHSGAGPSPTSAAQSLSPPEQDMEHQSRAAYSPFASVLEDEALTLEPTLVESHDVFRHRYADRTGVQSFSTRETHARSTTPPTSPIQELENPWDQE